MNFMKHASSGNDTMDTAPRSVRKNGVNVDHVTSSNVLRQGRNLVKSRKCAFVRRRPVHVYPREGQCFNS